MEAESVNLSASAKERRPVVKFIDNTAVRLGLKEPGSDMKAALSLILMFFVKWSFIGPDKPKSSIPGEPSRAQPQDYHDRRHEPSSFYFMFSPPQNQHFVFYLTGCVLISVLTHRLPPGIKQGSMYFLKFFFCFCNCVNPGKQCE